MMSTALTAENEEPEDLFRPEPHLNKAQMFAYLRLVLRKSDTVSSKPSTNHKETPRT